MKQYSVLPRFVLLWSYHQWNNPEGCGFNRPSINDTKTKQNTNHAYTKARPEWIKSVRKAGQNVISWSFDYELLCHKWKNLPSNLKYKSHQIPKLKSFSFRLAVVFAESIEVDNEHVCGAAPTSKWSTILFPAKAQLILEISRYMPWALHNGVH